MKVDVAERWVAALRSGEYPQGHGALYVADDGEDTGFCCLGVLCDLYAKETGLGQWRERTDYDGHTLTSRGFVSVNSHPVSGGAVGLPPYEVTEWAGLKDPSPQFFDGQHQTSLVALNDGNSRVQRVGFAEIASAIEAHVEEL